MFVCFRPSPSLRRDLAWPTTIASATAAAAVVVALIRYAGSLRVREIVEMHLRPNQTWQPPAKLEMKWLICTDSTADWLTVLKCDRLLHLRSSRLKPKTTGGNSDLKWQCIANCHLLQLISRKSLLAIAFTKLHCKSRAERLYSALHGIQTTWKRSGMDHTVLPAINTTPAFTS